MASSAPRRQTTGSEPTENPRLITRADSSDLNPRNVTMKKKFTEQSFSDQESQAGTTSGDRQRQAYVPAGDTGESVAGEVKEVKRDFDVM
ncbi:hypothetical protein V1264_006730 [Littorina saxatilis]|uniref:Uncharacterized protein n=1 Tax=Littorina saxatilis TaxID=31220 RepID=A0AAN9AY56_9CAEN